MRAANAIESRFPSTQSSIAILKVSEFQKSSKIFADFTAVNSFLIRSQDHRLPERRAVPLRSTATRAPTTTQTATMPTTITITAGLTALRHSCRRRRRRLDSGIESGRTPGSASRRLVLLRWPPQKTRPPLKTTVLRLEVSTV